MVLVLRLGPCKVHRSRASSERRQKDVCAALVSQFTLFYSLPLPSLCCLIAQEES
jgi:hypothetical protein